MTAIELSLAAQISSKLKTQSTMHQVTPNSLHKHIGTATLQTASKAKMGVVYLS